MAHSLSSGSLRSHSLIRYCTMNNSERILAYLNKYQEKGSKTPVHMACGGNKTGIFQCPPLMSFVMRMLITQVVCGER